MLINGLIAAIIGIILLFIVSNNGDVFQSIIKWVGIILIIVSATLIGVDIYAAVKKRHWGSLAFVSAFLLIIGIIFAANPQNVLWFVSIVAGIWAAVTGVSQIITTIKYRQYVPGFIFTIINGILMIALGVMFIFFQEILMKTFTYIAGAFLVVSGLWEIFNAFRFKKITKISDEVMGDE